MTPNRVSFLLDPGLAGRTFHPLRLLCALLAGVACVASLMQPATAEAQAAVNAKIEIAKISPAFVSTPDYEFQGDKKRTPGRPGKWLEVEVEFSSDAEVVEELTFNYYILLNKKLLVGEVTHVNIPKGASLFSVMYVSPRSIDRLMEGKPVTGNSIENIAVEIKRQGALVTSKSFNERMRAAWWQTLTQLPGLVINKNETPFAPLYWDRYEAIRTTR